jgi:hypothetical protein
MRALMLFGIGLVLAFTAIGCGGPYWIDFQLRSSPPDGDVDVSRDRVQLEEGMAIAVVARPIDDDEIMSNDTPVLLEAANTQVFGAERGEYDEDTERYGDWAFILYGKRAGGTVMDVWIDGELEGEISVFVAEQ